MVGETRKRRGGGAGGGGRINICIKVLSYRGGGGDVTV